MGARRKVSASAFSGYHARRGGAVAKILEIRLEDWLGFLSEECARVQRAREWRYDREG